MIEQPGVEPNPMCLVFPDNLSSMLNGKMSHKVLIVEDEFLVALNLKHTLSVLGFETVGIAPDLKTAYALAEQRPDFALVDVNLRDGATGPEIGVQLAQKYGASVLFVTANPRQLNGCAPGAVGMLSKPYDDKIMGSAMDFLLNLRAGEAPTPPDNITIFNQVVTAN